MKLTASVVL